MPHRPTSIGSKNNDGVAFGPAAEDTADARRNSAKSMNVERPLWWIALLLSILASGWALKAVGLMGGSS